MTVEELKQSHPDVYNSIFNAGKNEERDRTGSWLAHIGTNQEKVIAGIKGGNSISASEREELIVEATTKRNLKNLEDESAQAIRTQEGKEGTQGAGASQTESQEEVSSFYGGIDAKLKTA